MSKPTSSAHPFTTTTTLLLLLIFSTPNPAFPTPCHQDDLDALLRIKSSFGNPSHLSSWDPATSCCGGGWLGVACDAATGRVVNLSISDADIASRIPPAIADLTHLSHLLLRRLDNLFGPIPPQFSNLTHLTTLQITNCATSGEIPAFLGGLTALELLDLSYNRLSGGVPLAIGDLPNLADLRLDRNLLTGPLPASFGRGFSKSRPPALHLSMNTLNGSLPTSLGELHFPEVDLSWNFFTGDASFLFGKGKKETRKVDLSRNFFEFDFGGVEFPESLEELVLNHNNIYGKIPVGLAELRGLKKFNVSTNLLCGEIPGWGSLARFGKSAFSNNKCAVSGQQLCGVPLDPCKRIKLELNIKMS